MFRRSTMRKSGDLGGAIFEHHVIPLVLLAAAFLCVAPLPHPVWPVLAHKQTSPDNISAFVDGTVVPMDSERVLRDQIVLVGEGRILEIGSSKVVRVPPGAHRIDAQGLFLLPGLADMHVHLVEGEVYFPLFLANGITTVRNMAGGPEMSALRDRVKRGVLIGPTIYTAGPILDGSPPVWEGSDVAITPEQARSAVEKQKNASYDFLKVYDNLLPAAYDAILQAAAQAHMPVAGHVPPHVGLQRVLDAHQRSIEHLTGYFEWLQNDRSPFKQSNEGEAFPHPAHLLAKRQALVNWLDESRIRQIAEATAKAGTWNVPTLVAWRNMTPHTELEAAWKRPGTRYATSMLHEWWNSHSGYSSGDWAAKRRGDTVRLKLTRALHHADARLLVGTDTPHPFVVPGFSVHEELSNFVEAGLSPYGALKAATVDAAEFVGAAGEFGVVKSGARADLILVEGNPLEDVKNASRIVGVMVRGHWLSREALQRSLDATGGPPSTRSDGALHREEATGVSESTLRFISVKERHMKTVTRLFTLLLLFAGSGFALAQQAPSGEHATALQTVSQIEDNSVSIVERGLVQAADAMPETKYSFAPTNGEFKGVRTFALQVKHVAASNYAMGSAILREAPPVDLGSENGPESMTSKADIMKFLKDSFAYLHRAASSMNEKNATEQVPNPEGAGTVPKLDIATRQLWHAMDHYGQMVLYLRMNGIVPPASRRRL